MFIELSIRQRLRWGGVSLNYILQPVWFSHSITNDQSKPLQAMFPEIQNPVVIIISFFRCCRFTYATFPVFTALFLPLISQELDASASYLRPPPL